MFMDLLKKKNNIWWGILIFIVLTPLVFVENNMAYVLIGYLLVLSACLSYSKAMAVFAFSLCFKACFASHFKLYILLMLIVLFIKSFALFKLDKWERLSKTKKTIFALFILYVLITPIICSIVSKAFLWSKYVNVLIFMLMALVGYNSYKNVDLKLMTQALVLGLICSSFISILYVLIDFVEIDIVFKDASGNFAFSGLSCSTTDLMLISIITLTFLAYYCLNLKRTIYYIFILPIVLIGLLTMSKLFVVLLILNLIIFAIVALLNDKTEGHNTLAVISIFTLIIVAFILVFALLFNKEFNLFEMNEWKGLFKDYKTDYKLSWGIISSKKSWLWFGVPMKKQGTYFAFSGIMNLLSNLGIVGCVVVLLAIGFAICYKKSFLDITLVLIFLISSIFINTFSLFGFVLLGICVAYGDNFNEYKELDYLVEFRALKLGMYQVIKRMFDIVVAIFGLIVACIPMIVVSIAVKLSSKGPVFFRDKRVGKDGKTIVVLKFRSMYEDAEARLEQYLTKEQLEMWKKERKVENDPRITKVGKFIRKTSLDELPQLFNILKGDLSIVGNRPLSRLEYDTYFSLEDKKILDSFSPGLTGYWQAYGRSNVTFLSKKRQEMYIYYPKNASVWLDIKIFFKTIIVVLTRKGAK